MASLHARVIPSLQMTAADAQVAKQFLSDTLNDWVHEKARPAAEVSCRLGYTADHAACALLYIVLLGWVLHFRRRVARFPQGLYCGLLAVNVPVHMLLGGVCHSRAISAVVHAYLALPGHAYLALPVFWLNGSLFVLNGVNILLCLCLGLVIFGRRFFGSAMKISMGANMVLLTAMAKPLHPNHCNHMVRQAC